MLYWLLHERLGINLFRYPSTRMLLAAAFALLLSIWLGPVFIRWLRRMAIGQEVREDGPATHAGKKGTPTMGGTLILFASVVPTLLFADLTNILVWFVLIVLVGYGAARIVGELFREPDAHLGFLFAHINMGQILSLPMILAGLAIIGWALRGRARVNA